jgi:hypothetical protein
MFWSNWHFGSAGQEHSSVLFHIIWWENHQFSSTWQLATDTILTLMLVFCPSKRHGETKERIVAERKKQLSWLIALLILS